jgi:hypothetical protein
MARTFSEFSRLAKALAPEPTFRATPPATNADSRKTMTSPCDSGHGRESGDTGADAQPPRATAAINKGRRRDWNDIALAIEWERRGVKNQRYRSRSRFKDHQKNLATIG